MKKYLSLLVAGLVLFTGCSLKSPETSDNYSFDVPVFKEARFTIQGVDINGNYFTAQFDGVTGALRVITNEEAEIHEEHSYSVCNVTDLGNAEVMDVLIITPDSTDEAHLLWSIEHESETSLRVYQGVTVTDNGTELNSFNRDLNSSNTAATKIYVGPTVTDLGDLICEAQSGSGRTIGGTERSSHERVLKTNTYYLLRITNETALNNVISLLIEWYEHTSGG